MQQLGQYIVSLTASALICGILLSLFPEGAVRSLLRLCCGVFLTVTALSPLPGIRLPDISFPEDFLQQGNTIASQGEKLALDARSESIKLGLEAYILDKAVSLGAEIQPEVTLDAACNPIAVTLRGRWEIDIRQALTAVITNDLGIPEEDQQWIQEKQWLESENSGGSTGGPP